MKATYTLQNGIWAPDEVQGPSPVKQVDEVEKWVNIGKENRARFDNEEALRKKYQKEKVMSNIESRKRAKAAEAKFNTKNEQVELFYNGGAKYDANNTQNVKPITSQDIDEITSPKNVDPKYADIDTTVSKEGMLPWDKQQMPAEKSMSGQIDMFQSSFEDKDLLNEFEQKKGAAYFNKDRQIESNRISTALDGVDDETADFLRQIDPSLTPKNKGAKPTGKIDPAIKKRLQRAEDAQMLKQYNNAPKEVTLDIPTESKIRNKAIKETTEELTNTTGKVVGKNADDVAKQVSKFGKVGRIAAGLGVGAVIISNMNKNKGQQTNGQLYGQQTPYGY